MEEILEIENDNFHSVIFKIPHKILEMPNLVKVSNISSELININGIFIGFKHLDTLCSKS
jgi:hypothetical protein